MSNTSLESTKTRFTNFVANEHPDPDFLMAKSVGDALYELSSLADRYVESIGFTHCRTCGRKLDHHKKLHLCTTCLTTKA